MRSNIHSPDYLVFSEALRAGEVSGPGELLEGWHPKYLRWRVSGWFCSLLVIAGKIVYTDHLPQARGTDLKWQSFLIMGAQGTRKSAIPSFMQVLVP
jgi:hypothetical protein